MPGHRSYSLCWKVRVLTSGVTLLVAFVSLKKVGYFFLLLRPPGAKVVPPPLESREPRNQVLSKILPKMMFESLFQRFSLILPPLTWTTKMNV